MNGGFFFYYDTEESIEKTISGIVFQNVYYLANEFGSNEDWEAIQYYYTDIYGIIAYELYNGEVYEIDISCLPEKTK